MTKLVKPSKLINSKSLSEWLFFYENLHHIGIDMGLSRVDKVWKSICLEKKINKIAKQKIITVAGTNGKGSSCKMLVVLLRSLGFTVGCEISPHILTFNERIQINESNASDIDIIEAEFEAISLAREIDIEHCEAILRVEQGSKVSKMSSKEIKRDLLIFAKRNPLLFLELANDDNVELRNFAIKAVEARVIKLSADQRSFSWASNGKKLMTVPFEENPYSAFAVWLKTDDGVEVYKSIDKKLK